MRLVIQCSVCGTIMTVGTAICGTCHSTGFQNLRLLFECQSCFRLGLAPACGICSKLLSLDPDDAAPGPAEITPEEVILPATVLEEEPIDEAILIEDEHPGEHVLDDMGEFELAPDDYPVAELNDEDLRLDDESDSVVEGK